MAYIFPIEHSGIHHCDHPNGRQLADNMKSSKKVVQFIINVGCHSCSTLC